ncbi:ROK family protein [Microbacterium sp. B2969]|uniref:ROK family protein n=1 Tax=Microbacterium alkaliflavum TaxID=3248839 RepID=A0ABW7Q5B5_9MICO
MSELPTKADAARESATDLLGPGEAVLTFDVGGTDTKSALIARDGRILGLRRTPTPRSDSDPAGVVIESVTALAATLRAHYPEEVPAAAGLSVPGLVDEAAGIARFASNLGWTDVPMHELAQRALALPVAFGHDVRAAGEAEARLGAARGFEDSIVIAIGTGIAGAIVLGGRPHSAHGYAAELGHTLADPNGERCPCGARGCLETIASAGAIARRYRAASGVKVAGAREVLAAAQSGDATARLIWSEAVTAIAEHLARLVATIAPQAIVIGGGLAEAGDALFVPLGRHLDDLLSFHRRPLLLKARFGDDAGLLGTALAARDLLAHGGVL